MKADDVIYNATRSTFTISTLACLLVSCATLTTTIPNCLGFDVREIKTPQDLEDNYRSLWNTMHGAEERSNIHRGLVQQGIPTHDSIVLWYLLEHDEDDHDELKVEIRDTKNDTWVEKKHTLHRIKDWPSGRLTISNLQPDTSYDVRVNINTTTRVELRASTNVKKTDPTPDLMSFILFSCNEPYSKSRKGILARDIISWQLLRNRALGTDEVDSHIPKRPSFALGLGDQIYVDPDADYAVDNPTASLSFFRGTYAGKSDVNRLIDFRRVDDYMRTVYRYNLAFPPTDQAFSQLPTAMIWDDHEIRDGWGSQGDESELHWQAYFQNVRTAYLAHQALRNPTIGAFRFEKMPEKEYIQRGEIQEKHSLFAAKDGFYPESYTQFSWGTNLRVFLMDQRTQRDYKRNRLMGETQWKAIEAWLSSAPKDDEITFVLGSAVPMFLKRTFIGDLGDIVSPELEDDLRDGFDSDTNKEHRERLVGILINHFRDHPKHHLLVVSGDVHTSGILYLELDTPQGRRIVGHEVISSGIAHGSDILSQSIYNMGVDTGTFEAGANASGTIRSYARGNIENSPAVVEIVMRTEDGKRGLGVVFHTSVFLPENDLTQRLANVPHTTKPARSLRFFRQPEHFTQETIHSEDASFSGSIVPLFYDHIPKTYCLGDKKHPHDLVHRLSTMCIVNNSKASEDIAQNWDTPIQERTCTPTPLPKPAKTTDCIEHSPTPE